MEKMGLQCGKVVADDVDALITELGDAIYPRSRRELGDTVVYEWDVNRFHDVARVLTRFDGPILENGGVMSLDFGYKLVSVSDSGQVETCYNHIGRECFIGLFAQEEFFSRMALGTAPHIFTQNLLTQT